MYTAEQLIREIRNLAALNNTGSEGATDADILLHINAAIKESVLPMVHNQREDYYVVRERVTPDTSGAVRVPERAAWNKLSNLFWVDSQGQRRYLSPLRPESLHEQALSGDVPGGYILEGNLIQLFPATDAGELELVYFFRPGELVLSKDARQVVSVDPDTGEVIVDQALPSSWDTSDEFDCHSGASGAEIKTWSISASSVSTTSLTFAASDMDGSTFGRQPIETGDWICIANEAALPAVPIEWQPIIVRAVAARYAEAEGDQAGLQNHTAWLDRAMLTAAKTGETRVERKPARLSLRRGTLWATRMWGGRNWRST